MSSEATMSSHEYVRRSGAFEGICAYSEGHRYCGKPINDPVHAASIPGDRLEPAETPNEEVVTLCQGCGEENCDSCPSGAYQVIRTRAIPAPVSEAAQQSAPIPDSVKSLARLIVERVAHDTASILHTRHDLGLEDAFAPVTEEEFCEEAENLANGEEIGCAEEEEAWEGSLLCWAEKAIAGLIAPPAQQIAILKQSEADLRALLADRDAEVKRLRERAQ